MQDRGPKNLPRCEYPKAAELEKHGLFNLPPSLSTVNFLDIEAYRSQTYSTVSLNQLTKAQILEMARMVARSFAQHEPMKKHLKPPRNKPGSILQKIHDDSFGQDAFGEWTAENLVYWFIRLFILTKPSDPIGKIGTNDDLNKCSLAILNRKSQIIGGAFNITVPAQEQALRKSDPFLDAVWLADKPIFDLIFAQEHEATEALKEKYPDFKIALAQEKVGLHFMVAKSPELPTEDAFELVASSAERFMNDGFKYMLTCASNQWTGAACEVLNGTRVHFTSFRSKQRVSTAENASPTESYSEDGYISQKDSGAMFYIIKLK